MCSAKAEIFSATWKGEPKVGHLQHREWLYKHNKLLLMLAPVLWKKKNQHVVKPSSS